MTGTSTGDLQVCLEEMSNRHRVPGASLAVLCDDQILTAACGVVNVETGVQTTTDTVFQIGSITKVLTTTLVLQLVDEKRLELDSKVASVLSDFALADPQASDEITLRHLLNHTSGIDGDHFFDAGRNDDAVATYVRTCREVGLVHPVGATMSYCNSGFVIAGRVVEELTGLPWREALRTRLLEPVGMQHTTTSAEEALRFRVAYGHEVDQSGRPTLVSQWQMPASLAPAGTTLCATATDLVAFAKMHLDSGRSHDGTQVLSASAVAAMQQPEVRVPEGPTFGSAWGLGWSLYDWGGRRLLGHDGSTLGQASYLRVVPDARVAVALLTNGGHTDDLYRELFGTLLRELCGLAMPPAPEPSDPPATVDPAPYAGTYECNGRRIELTAQDGRLAGRIIATGAIAEAMGELVEEVSLTPVNDSVFATRPAGVATWVPMVFFTLPDGSKYLHFGLRAMPKRG